MKGFKLQVLKTVLRLTIVLIVLVTICYIFEFAYLLYHRNFLCINY